jgi:prepilin-type N-terminal cleavage/methylation domain-containing protein
MNGARRGMTLLEVLLAIAITGLVGAGITAMMSALTTSMIDQHDTRSSTLRAGLTQARLSSYITRCRCLLDCEADRIVLWLEDADGDDAIDATEVRWISHDSSAGKLRTQWILDPDELVEYPYANPTLVDWWSELTQLDNSTGLRSGSIDLVHGVEACTFATTAASTPQARRAAAMARRTVEANYTLVVADTRVTHCLGDSIRMHDPPEEQTP